MQVDEQLISRLEHLARLELSPAERKRLQHDLTDILDMVDKLNELDTTDVPPLIYLNETAGELRIDQVGAQLDREEALCNAPDADSTYFRVPKVIER